MGTGRAERPLAARSTAAVPAATIGVNLISYLLLLCAARVLVKSSYGELVALLGVLLVATVPALAVQTVAARRIATASHSAALTRATTVVALAATAGLIVITPLLDRFLHLNNWGAPIAVAAAIPATTFLGTYQGLAQGSQNFSRFAAMITLATGGRSTGGLIGVVLGRSPMWCLIGVAIGSSVAAVIGRAVAVEHPPSARTDAPTDEDGLRHLLIEIVHAAHAHGAFLLLTSLDILLARHVLSPDDAGVYAAGSVVTRAALWLPQSVAMVMFASLTDHARHRRSLRRAILAVGAVGLFSILGTVVLGRLVVSVVGGHDYHQLDDYIWMFAALGAALALIQLAILAGLAVRRRGRIILVWVVAIAETAVVLGVSPSTPRDTIELLVVIAATGAVAAVLLAADVRSRPIPAERSSDAAIGSLP